MTSTVSIKARRTSSVSRFSSANPIIPRISKQQIARVSKKCVRQGTLKFVRYANIIFFSGQDIATGPICFLSPIHIRTSFPIPVNPGYHLQTEPYPGQPFSAITGPASCRQQLVLHVCANHLITKGVSPCMSEYSPCYHSKLISRSGEEWDHTSLPLSCHRHSSVPEHSVRSSFQRHSGTVGVNAPDCF